LYFIHEKYKAQAQAVALFQDLGTAPVIDEKLMDAATVLAASGTAFALRYINQCRLVSK
jgi:pyrroline-5-carboxylate reductase